MRSKAWHGCGAMQRPKSGTKWHFFGVFQAFVHWCTPAASSTGMQVDRRPGFAIAPAWLPPWAVRPFREVARAIYNIRWCAGSQSDQTGALDRCHSGRVTWDAKKIRESAMAHYQRGKASGESIREEPWGVGATHPFPRKPPGCTHPKTSYRPFRIVSEKGRNRGNLQRGIAELQTAV